MTPDQWFTPDRYQTMYLPTAAVTGGGEPPPARRPRPQPSPRPNHDRGCDCDRCRYGNV